jgi:hypothetical protein
MAMGAAYTAQ